MDTTETKLLFSYLKTRVLDLANLKTVSAADCEALSILLTKTTGKYLSITTVKRIYGFAQMKFAPSAFTKNVLAKFCGFDNWDDYAGKVSLNEHKSLLALTELLVPADNRLLLKPFLDTLMIRILVLRAVYNEDGAISDFRIELANQAMENVTGRKDLPGKLYSQEYPGTKRAGIYAMMLSVMETGQPGQMEYYYPYDGLNAWYSSLFVKTDVGLLTIHYEPANAFGSNNDLLDFSTNS